MKFQIYDTVEKRYIKDSYEDSTYITINGKVVCISTVGEEIYEENPNRYILTIVE
jgi:hypothetical protein